jgi:F0F1-type ATP synthase delta subunit
MSNIQTLFGNLSSEDVKAIRTALGEVSDVMTKMESCKEEIKNIIVAMHDKYKIPKKILSRMAKVHHNQNFLTTISEDKEFETIYTCITEVK